LSGDDPYGLNLQMKPIRKAIIPAAGLGTRFLPATKSIPKEMLPIIDRPSILFNVEEAVRAGIEDIIIIAGRGKESIENFFDRSYELEDFLSKAGKTDLLERIKHVRNLANIISIRQKEALGLGHAVLTGRPVVGDEPFAVLLGDEIMIGKPGVTDTLSKSFAKTGLSSVAIMNVPKEDVVKYGIVAVEEDSDSDSFKILDVIEKPSVEKAPSTWALPGRYVFSASIFKELSRLSPGKNGEIQLTDAMVKLAKTEGLLGITFKDLRYDTGDKFGYVQANVELALSHPELGAKMRAYIKDLAGRL